MNDQEQTKNDQTAEGGSGEDKPRRRKRRRRRGKRDGEQSGQTASSQTTSSQTTSTGTAADDDDVDDDDDRPRRPKKRSSDYTRDTSIFELEQRFADLGLRDSVLAGIERMGFEHPTHVQATLVPMALEGRDIMGQSKTGTGKTAAFGLPLLHQIEPGERFSGFCLTPTRELAIQVAHELRELGRDTGLSIIPVYGGQQIRVQAEKLKKNPEIIVGTPGRVMDMHQRGLLPYEHVRLAILDEVDRMLDIGFREDIRRILGGMPKDRQTIFVSATISQEIEKLAQRYMRSPEQLDLAGSASLTVNQVTQRYVTVPRWDKNRMLVHVLKQEQPALTLVFCRTKATVDGLTEYLNRKGIEAHAIHGDMYQRKRNRVMQKLRDGELSVLIASDLAARGLDVDDISHVINYDLPEDPEVYVHRIGRTARAGRDGWALAFVTPEQGELLTAIEMLTNVEIEGISYEDFEPGQVPRDVAEAQARTEEARAKRAAQVARMGSGIAPPKQEEVDPSKYPGGIVPSAVPTKRLGGRLRTRRR